MSALYELVAQHRSLEALAASEDLPVEMIADTLEGLEGEVTQKATSVAKFVMNCEATAEAIEKAAAQMMIRAKRLNARAEHVRNYLYTNMKAAGILKIEALEFTVSVKKNPPAVNVLDETMVPAEYMVTPPPPPPPPPPAARPDKKKIADALKADIDIPGCELVRGERLEIKA